MIPKGYILCNEIVEKAGINIANFSKIRSDTENTNSTVTIKRGKCIFIKAQDRMLPTYIAKHIYEHEWTDMSDKLPCSYVKSELDIGDEGIGVVFSDKITICGKQFYQFLPEYAAKFKKKVLYTLNEAEATDCKAKGLIRGAVRITEGKMLTWY